MTRTPPAIHLDTDIGGDPDDVCALAMLLGSDAELTAVTTTVDPRGQRAGYAAYVLGLAGRSDVPLAAGAEATITASEVVEPLPELWPAGVAPLPGVVDIAHDLLLTSIQRGATILAVGPLSTLASLERRWPGALAGARVVVMGGWTGPLAADLPAYGPGDDWNVAVDPEAAAVVATSDAQLTWVPLATTLRASLRERALPRLRRSGALGRLLADQAVAYAELRNKAELGRAHAGLPDDLVIPLHDPVAAAVALGCPAVTVRRHQLTPVRTADGLVLERDPAGLWMHVATDVDGAAFADGWLGSVGAADRAATR